MWAGFLWLKVRQDEPQPKGLAMLNWNPSLWTGVGKGASRARAPGADPETDPAAGVVVASAGQNVAGWNSSFEAGRQAMSMQIANHPMVQMGPAGIITPAVSVQMTPMQMGPAVSVSINVPMHPMMQMGPPMQMRPATILVPGQVGLSRGPAGHVEEAADHEVPTRDQLGDRAAGPTRALKDGPHVPKPAKGAPQPKMKPQPKFGNIQSGAAGRALALAAAVSRPPRSRPIR